MVCLKRTFLLLLLLLPLPTTVLVLLVLLHDLVGWMETSYDVTYEDTSRSRARTLSKYSLEGVPLGLSPFSHHRSVKNISLIP
jgi:hypothetical protein